MKKIAAVCNMLIILLCLINCESPTFDCTIENKSDYPAKLSLRYTKYPKDTISLKQKEKITVSFFYPGDNVKLISKNYNELEKLSEYKYVINNSKPVKYTVHNFLPISITLLDNNQFLLVDKNTQKNTSKINISSNISDCYFFTNITLNNIIIETNTDIKKIANFYYLQISNGSNSKKHRINIDISSSSNEIIFSY